MRPNSMLAIISRIFFANKKVTRYRMKKIDDMTDVEVISNCHTYCEENNLVAEWKRFREKAESEYRYCSYLEEYIDEGLCYDLQMILENYITPSALPELNIDKEKCAKCCSDCKYRL